MAEITQKTIKKLAELSRLKLTQEEEKRFAKDISSILIYVATLQEVDTKGIKPTAQVTGLHNKLREDEVSTDKLEKELIALAPESKDNRVLTRKVL